MTKQLYFRVDDREFKPGDQIRTAGRFMSKHSRVNQVVEKVLDSGRPAGKLPRQKCLMLFDDKTLARGFWLYVRKGGFFYTVSLGGGRILHRGDRKLLGKMAQRMERGKNVVKLARRYWAGELTKDPRVEVLALTGTIVDVEEYDWARETDEPVCQCCGNPLAEDENIFGEPGLCSWCHLRAAKDD